LEVLLFPVCGRKPKDVCTLMDAEFTLEPHLQSMVFERTRQSILAKTGLMDDLNNDNKDQANTNKLQ
jgi:hypothetical protein